MLDDTVAADGAAQQEAAGMADDGSIGAEAQADDSPCDETPQACNQCFVLQGGRAVAVARADTPTFCSSLCAPYLHCGVARKGTSRSAHGG